MVIKKCATRRRRMSASASRTLAVKPRLQRVGWPRTLVARFVARQTIRSATFVALAFATFTVSKTVGYVAVYPTVKERLSAATLESSNAGIVALYGTPHHIESVPGFAAWYALCMGVLIGSV